MLYENLCTFEEFTCIQQQTEARLTQRGLNPQLKAEDAFHHLIFGKDHAYAAPISKGTACMGDLF